MFKVFPLIIAVAISWSICGILTASGSLTNNPNDPAYQTRTDLNIGVLKKTKWFRMPYPGQWGTPTVTVAGVFGLLAGVLTSLVESVGDYYACAQLSGAPPPPRHAINRGIGIEGIGGVIAGGLGGGIGVSSYSSNIAAITITKVGSRRVILCASLIMMFSGVLGKLGALFSTIPAPVIGGMFLVLFGLIAAIGISNLQQADMSSARNLSIFGLSILAGMGIPYWVRSRQHVIKTGSTEGDQILTVLLTTEIAVGGVLAMILDSTAPGTRKERGFTNWESASDREGDKMQMLEHTRRIYSLPRPLQKMIDAFGIGRYVPCLPYDK